MSALKNNLKIFKKGWTAYALGAIICALFALFLNSSAGEAASKAVPKVQAEAKAPEEDAKERVALEAELARLKAANAALAKELEAARRELIETSQVYSRQSERLKRIEISAAAAVETLEPVYVGSREEEMAESLRLLSEASAKLAYNTSSLCEDLDATVSELPMDKVAQARIRLRLDGLRKEARDMAVLASPPGQPVKFEKCRVLDYDKSLKTAVVSAGYRDGVRNGLLLSSGPDRRILLRVVAVRSLVSAAKVVEGDPDALLPGMEAFAGAVSK
jgi:hypothetical protein